MPPPAQLFISYRRDDSAGYARALNEALARAYGHERVFMDVDDIAAGQRFADVIHRALGSAAVLLVLIGPRWTGPRQGAAPRIHDADDFVRREVEAGLGRGLHLVPVLLDGTPLPAAPDLPPSLRPMLQHHALALGSAGFQAQVAHLLAALQPLMGPPAEGPAPAGPAPVARRPLLRAGAAALLLGLAGAGLWWARRGPHPGDWAGDWEAEVSYPWPNAVYTERIRLRAEDQRLAGSVSFLRVPRVIGDVALGPDSLRFSTRTTSEDGVDRWEDLHRYRLQRRSDGTLQVEMQTDSRGVAGPVLRFTARPRPPAGGA